MDNSIIFIRDKEINEELNNKLIAILSTCFSNQPIFSKQRFYKELPQLRWYLEDRDKIVAHLAMHEKEINTEIGNVLIGGIAEVCVHPDSRGLGIAKKLLEEANLYSVKKNHKFSMLYGETNVYSSSGYCEVYNNIKYLDDITNEVKIEKAKDLMVKKLSNIEWPKGLIDINGPTF